MDVQLESTWLNENSKREPTRYLAGHQHTNKCDWPVGVVQQTDINSKGETILGCVDSKRSIVELQNRWIFEKTEQMGE